MATGAVKPTSTFSLERVDDRTKVIAHATEPIDRFTIEDAPLLRAFIDGELRLGLDLALDARIVAALIEEATEGESTLDIAGIRSALTTLQLIEMAPNGIAMNPTSWEAIEMEALEDFGSNPGTSPATDAKEQRLFSVPVVVYAMSDVLVMMYDGKAIKPYRVGNAQAQGKIVAQGAFETEARGIGRASLVGSRSCASGRRKFLGTANCVT